jgi:hypothetical protein
MRVIGLGFMSPTKEKIKVVNFNWLFNAVSHRGVKTCEL